jgi:uncharacterized protein
MTSASMEDLWGTLDRRALAAIVEAGPPALFATISGAHLYGFASADSDVDLRGAFVLPVRDLLGLDLPDETWSVTDVRGGLELDWVAHDIRKFARMMVRDNGYVLEQLLSPLTVVTGDEHRELVRIGRGCITRGLYRHYRGFAASRRKLLAEPGATVKHLLYAYRVYLTGIHVLRSGEIECNLDVLNHGPRVPQISDLLAQKRGGREKEPLGAGEIEAHLPELDRLEAELEEAHAESALPLEPTTRPALEAFVVEARLRREER